MRIRGIDFGNVWCASGALGFFGEGYPYQRLLKPLGWTLEGKVVFVAKTTTLHPRLNPEKGEGNMRLKEDGITPAEFMPDCVRVYPTKGVALNSVGLSGPGASALLKTKRWQNRTEPFWISFMSVAKTKKERLLEFQQFVVILEFYKHEFKARFGLQINISCPNVGLDTSELVEEAVAMGAIANTLGIPFLFKVTVQVPVRDLMVIERIPGCDGIVDSNTVNWNQLKDIGIDPCAVLDVPQSPLVHLRGGGWSGCGMHFRVCEQIRDLRKAGFKKIIIGENETYSPEQAAEKIDAGADGVGLGSISFLRPWRIEATVRAAELAAANREHFLIQIGQRTGT